ncbi:PKD domain-containing protein [bacterium]|nr:PKD domain-containing protein [bacterium]
MNLHRRNSNGNRHLALLAGLLLWTGSTLTAAAAAPWHLSGWQARAVVTVPQPRGEAEVDTAGVKILGLGRGRDDGADYRVLDANGQAVPFQVMFHDGARYSLVSFRCADPRQTYYVYFGNPQAARAREEIAADSAPGSGPPRGDWVPRHGFVFATIRRPAGDNPKTVDELRALIAASPARFGGRYQQRVADGYNPFGSSDAYISLYRGWVRVAKPGKYWFCNISNEASFSFLDGQELIHWPGRHTVERGIHGEKNAAVELTAGLHYLEYYQEEVALQQMACLGWRPFAEHGPFSPIPETFYTAPHAAVVSRYESPRGPLPVFEPEIVDSIWPETRQEGQYTRVRFRATVAGDSSRCAWEFGDGQTGAGPEVEHVYLRTNVYQVALTAGGETARWPLEVYEIQQVNDQQPAGNLADYLTLVRGDNRARLDADSLKEFGFLLAEAGAPRVALAAARDFLARFPGASPVTRAHVRRLEADCAAQLGEGSAGDAIAAYEAVLKLEPAPDRQLEALAGLIRLLGVDRGALDQLEPLVERAEQIARGAPARDEPLVTAYRAALIAAGDGHLWRGKREDALAYYRRAEVNAVHPIPHQVRAARVGAYPNAVREYLVTQQFDAAAALVDRWETDFPLERASGETLFWRGNLLTARGDAGAAARHFRKSLELAPGVWYETAARWRLALALEQSGQEKEARHELARLAASGLNDVFVQRAREKLGNLVR